MIITRYILSLAVLMIGVFFAVMNWSAAIVSMRNKRRGIDKHHSTVPGVSLLPTMLAVMIYPYPNKAMWMLAVPLLDFANLNLILLPVTLPIMLIRASRKKKSAGGMHKEAA